ncbi:MAG: transcriptional regulator [Actinobacteria bacterium]|nr:transcriptional regulator [Actinomycetota bacterium]
MERRVDVGRLHAALDAERRDRGLSWRQVAAEADVSSSLFTRMGKGHSPDLESFAALVQWLGVRAEQFMRSPGGDGGGAQSALETELAPLLRARRDLTREDQDYLLDLINATTKFLKSQRREP